MKKIRNNFICLMLMLVAGAVFAEDAQDMMSQYKGMSEGTAKNFPSELDILMPKGFTIKNKGFIFKETANMFMFMSLTGTRKNEAYKNSGRETDIEIGIMAYNPQSASYMASQMQVVLQETKKGYSTSVANESGGQWECGQVAVSKINQADVYIQKCTLKNVEVEENKFENHVYYFAKAVLLNKNVLLNINIIYYPSKNEGVVATINEITKIVLTTNFDKFMK